MRPTPVSALPWRVTAPRGKLTLFADYEDIWQGQVVLYLVNRTSETVKFPAQDDDFYVKLEALSDSGQWKRVQPHLYSFCGNSYHEVSLDPGTYISLLGWVSPEGRQRQVRYRIYSEAGIASNVAFASVSDRSIEDARTDAMSRRGER